MLVSYARTDNDPVPVPVPVLKDCCYRRIGRQKANAVVIALALRSIKIFLIQNLQ